MKRPSCAFALLCCLAPALNAQEACKMEMNVPPLTLSEVYAKASANASAWKADAIPARLTNTSMGPLDEKGRSAAWSLMFYSPSAEAQMSVSTFNGMYTCYEMPGPAGRIPDLKPDFFRDGAKLYALAKEKGGNLIAEGYSVSIDTSAAPQTRHATWYITFSKPEGANADLTIIVDANTGSVEKVLTD